MAKKNSPAAKKHSHRAPKSQLPPLSPEPKPGKKNPSVKPSPAQAESPTEKNVNERAIAECFVNHVKDLFTAYDQVGKSIRPLSNENEILDECSRLAKKTQQLNDQIVNTATISVEYFRIGAKLQQFSGQIVNTPIITASSINCVDELSSEIAEIAKKVKAASAAELLAEATEIAKKVEQFTTRIKAGDESGVVLLVEMARLSCMELSNAMASHPQMVYPAIQENEAWPILWRPGKNFNESMTKVFEKIGLGSQCEPSLRHETAMKGMVAALENNKANFSMIAYCLHCMMHMFRGRGLIQARCAEFKRKADASALPLKPFIEGLNEKTTDSDIQLKRLLHDQFSMWQKTMDDQMLAEYTNECASLPEPSKESFPKWFKVARKLFLYLTNEHPEESPDLIKLVGSKEGDIIKIGQEKYTLEKSRGKIRDFIIRPIRQAFENQLFSKYQ